MFKKLAKKQILGLLAASAVVVTTMGTFAVWDTLEATSTGTLTVSNPIKVTTTNFSAMTETHERGTAPVYTAKVKFDIANDTDLTTAALKLDCEVTDNADKPIAADKVNISIAEAGTNLNNNTDNSLSTSNEYQLTISPTDTATDLAGQNLKVSVKGTLSTVAQ